MGMRIKTSPTGEEIIVVEPDTPEFPQSGSYALGDVAPQVAEMTGMKKMGGAPLDAPTEPSLARQIMDYKQEREQQDVYNRNELDMTNLIRGAMNKATEGVPSIARSGQESLARLVPSWQTMYASKPVPAKSTGIVRPTGEIINPSGGPPVSPTKSLADSLFDKAGTGADNLNFGIALTQALKSGRSLPEALAIANNARFGATATNANARGLGYGLGSNIGVVADAKVDLAGRSAKAREEAKYTVGQQPSTFDPTLSNIEAKSKAEFMGKGLPADVQDVLTGFANLGGVVNSIKTEFTPEEIDSYVGLFRRPILEWGQLINQDPKFARFAMLTNQAKNYAFELGGKQLTPFEAQVVFGFVPTGRELSTVDFMAKLEGMPERLNRIKTERLRAGTMTRGDVVRGGGQPQGGGSRRRYNPTTRSFEALP